MNRPLALAAYVVFAACATPPSYEREMASARTALAQGDPAAARVALEARLLALPADAPERALLGLELATIALREGAPDRAAHALAEADPLLEVVDLSRDDLAELASWLYADAARPYRTPPWEKLMVNLLGMASRLAAEDHAGAGVEALRFEVIARFLRDQGADPGLVLPLGQLLAALAHEAAGRPRVAARYDALAADALAARAAETPDDRGAGRGEVVLLILEGRLPHKVAERVSAEEAERVAVQPGAAAQLRQLGERELQLVRLASAGPTRELPRLELGDGRVAVVWADLASTARKSFEDARPRLARAAITRALSRGATHRSVAALDRRPREGDRRGLASALGAMLGETMRRADTPDTRSWSTLPARLGVARAALPAGHATLNLRSGDAVRTIDVAISPGARTFALVVLP